VGCVTMLVPRLGCAKSSLPSRVLAISRLGGFARQFLLPMMVQPGSFRRCRRAG
jgi:hypothetical protein